MKKTIGISVFSLVLCFATAANAQEKVKEVAKDVKKGAKEVGRDVKKGAKKVGNETAEVAAKGKAVVTDEVYKDKVAAGGQTVYIDNHSRYYWIDEKGKRHYVAESTLKPKDN